MIDHSSFLPKATAGALCSQTYIAKLKEIQRQPSPKVHVSASETTFGSGTRPLTQPVTFETYGEHRSSSPPRVLIEIARRCGLLAAAAAHDAGMSTPVLVVRP